MTAALNEYTQGGCMQRILESLTAQPFLVLVLAFLVALFAYALLKKLLKILAVISLLLVLYLGYLVYRGETIVLSKKNLKNYSEQRYEQIKQGAVEKATGMILKKAQ